MAYILLIEDDELYRKMLAHFLRRAGHEVVEARDGREGVDRFRSEPTDIVITDIVMPEQEGLETIRQLRALRPELSIIAISGAGAESGLYLKIAEKLGASCVIEKPFQPRDLVAAVEGMLQSH